MRLLIAALLVVGLSACPKRIGAGGADAPQLAPVDVLPLNVTFYGTPPNKMDLYVCGWVDEEFGCIERTLFETQLQQR